MKKGQLLAIVSLLLINSLASAEATNTPKFNAYLKKSPIESQPVSGPSFLSILELLFLNAPK